MKRYKLGDKFVTQDLSDVTITDVHRSKYDDGDTYILTDEHGNKSNPVTWAEIQGLIINGYLTENKITMNKLQKAFSNLPEADLLKIAKITKRSRVQFSDVDVEVVATEADVPAGYEIVATVAETPNGVTVILNSDADVCPECGNNPCTCEQTVAAVNPVPEVSPLAEGEVASEGDFDVELSEDAFSYACELLDRNANCDSKTFSNAEWNSIAKQVVAYDKAMERAAKKFSAAEDEIAKDNAKINRLNRVTEDESFVNISEEITPSESADAAANSNNNSSKLDGLATFSASEGDYEVELTDKVFSYACELLGRDANCEEIHVSNKRFSEILGKLEGFDSAIKKHFSTETEPTATREDVEEGTEDMADVVKKTNSPEQSVAQATSASHAEKVAEGTEASKTFSEGEPALGEVSDTTEQTEEGLEGDSSEVSDDNFTMDADAEFGGDDLNEQGSVEDSEAFEAMLNQAGEMLHESIDGNSTQVFSATTQSEDLGFGDLMSMRF